jgi:magnesium-transporting ATPase (P-type)
MNDKIMLGGVSFSLLVSITQLVLALLMVPHIFGIMLSITFIIINILILIYVLKVKKVLSRDVKMQYEELGRKRNETNLFKAMRIILGVSFVSANVLMVIMITTRSVSLVGYSENAMRNTFPYMCDEDSLEGCARLVLTRNSCKHTESITAKDYSLIMNTQVHSHKIGYYIKYCAQSIDIGSLKYPDSWPDSNLASGFIH